MTRSLANVTVRKKGPAARKERRGDGEGEGSKSKSELCASRVEWSDRVGAWQTSRPIASWQKPEPGPR